MAIAQAKIILKTESFYKLNLCTGGSTVCRYDNLFLTSDDKVDIMTTPSFKSYINLWHMILQ